MQNLKMLVGKFWITLLICGIRGFDYLWTRKTEKKQQIKRENSKTQC